jgi:hypothetical protein
MEPKLDPTDFVELLHWERNLAYNRRTSSSVGSRTAQQAVAYTPAAFAPPAPWL